MIAIADSTPEKALVLAVPHRFLIHSRGTVIGPYHYPSPRLESGARAAVHSESIEPTRCLTRRNGRESTFGSSTAGEPAGVREVRLSKPVNPSDRPRHRDPLPTDVCAA